MAEKNFKNWIDPGMFVEHIVTGGICLTVDKIVREPEGPDTDKGKIKGVLCHWLDKEGTYQTGLFHTKELRPWPHKALQDLKTEKAIQEQYNENP